MGLFEARRTGAIAASGEWVCCIDSDDTLPPDALLNFYEGLLASGNGTLANAADIIHGKMDLTVRDTDKIDAEDRKRFAQKAEIVKSVFNGSLYYCTSFLDFYAYLSPNRRKRYDKQRSNYYGKHCTI